MYSFASLHYLKAEVLGAYYCRLGNSGSRHYVYNTSKPAMEAVLSVGSLVIQEN